MRTITLEELRTYAGKELAPSEWFEVTQERINKFAESTDDHQFIHVDPDSAKRTRFGSTIAHGYLLLSLVSGHRPTDAPKLEDAVMSLNYGLNRVRFISPVRVNSMVRIHTRILSVTEKSPGNILVTYEKKMAIEGQGKPAFVAETLGMIVTEAPSKG